MELIGLLFDTSSFPARWHCGNWSALHGWVHITSDVLIFGAYLSIPAVLLYFKHRRPDVPFPRVFMLFGAFIVACGITHLNEAIIFWKPAYRWAGLVKLVTAAVSWATAIALIRIAPLALGLRSPASLEAEVAERTAELARSNADLQSFAYVASHDLKAPLRAIHNLSEWLEQDLAERLDDDDRKKMTLLRGRVHRMDQLLTDLLEYSRAGRRTADAEPLATRALVDGVVASQLAVPPGFTVEVAANLPELVGRRVPLEQVFRNLLANAIKHHDRAEGRLRVSASTPRPGWVEFVVTDDGPGIAPEFHERVFQLFQTLKPRDRVEGSGMGLALVRRLVNRQGGEVWIGAAEARGSAIHFTWPTDVTLETT